MRNLILALVCFCVAACGADPSGLGGVDVDADVGGSSGRVGRGHGDALTATGGVGGQADMGGNGGTGAGGRMLMTGGTAAGGSFNQGGAEMMGGAGGMSACVPQAEVCDGKDNDCNNVIDNDANCPYTRGVFAGHSYLFPVGPFTHEAGAAACASVPGYHLVKIETRDEDDWLKMSTALWAGFWIGATDLVTQGVWLWQDGTPATYTGWAAGQPNNFMSPQYPEGEHCVGSGPGGWGDAPCAATRAGAVCEAP